MKGSLTPGKLADVVLLDRDIFATSPSDLDKMRVTLTVVVSQPALNAAELVSLAERDRRRDGVLVSATAADIAKRDEQSWFNYIAWLANTGGNSITRLKELRRLGDSPEDLAALHWERTLEVEKSLCNWLRLQPSLPFELDAVLDSIVIIHKDMKPPQLSSAWWLATEDVVTKEREFEGGSPRQVFAAINARRGNKLRLVLQKTTDYPADFYLPNP